MFGRKKKENRCEKTFVDLNDHSAPMYAQSDARIKVVEMTSGRDLKAVTDMAYRGDILILDFSRFTEGDQEKKEIAKYLLSVSVDIKGAFTEVSDRLMVFSPSGLSIDKCRITYRDK